MDLSGTVKTPLGDVSKKTLLLGGGAVGILGILWYRNQKAKASIAAAGASEIDPATGYPYGSAEDAAALAAQAAYVSPGGSGGGGGGGGTASDSPVTNAQWSQKVIEYWSAHDLGDIPTITAAIGVYLSGGVPTSNQVDLIHQATAIAGLPPVSANGGYPPSINTGSGSTPPDSGGKDPGYDTTFVVQPGWHPDNWIADVRSNARGNPAFSWDLWLSLNPGAESDINKPSKTNRSTWTFTQWKRYRVR